MSSRSPRAATDLAFADQVLDRRKRHGRISFTTVLQAVLWCLEERQKMQAPHGMYPRTHTASDGSEVTVDVDGGPGGDLHEKLATLSTIWAELQHLREDRPDEHEIYMSYVQDREATLRKLSDRHGMSLSSISAKVGHAESYLHGRLRDVIR